MLEKFIFENHLGQRFEGLPNGVYLNYNDLRDYSWSYDTINNRISRFYRSMRDRKLPLVIKCDSDEEAIAVKNRLHELAEADIEAKIPGKIFVGDYYTSGYITASTKSNYLITKRLCYIELTLTSDDPAWYREQTHAFIQGEVNAIGIGGGTDYPYDYPYDYALSLKGQKVMCDSVGSSAFRLLIYGEAVNPSVVIGGHVYAINGTIGKGETLLIDSLSKTITLTTTFGNKINWFDKRGREDYIFEPIPAGQNTVSWLGTFGFDLTVIEKRSEPKWT
jgi:hypothetical protein